MPYYTLKDRGHVTRVIVNNVDVTQRCIIADTEHGEVVCYISWPPTIIGQGLKTETLYGNVVVDVQEDT